jgi:hypothetical protein
MAKASKIELPHLIGPLPAFLDGWHRDQSENARTVVPMVGGIQGAEIMITANLGFGNILVSLNRREAEPFLQEADMIR